MTVSMTNLAGTSPNSVEQLRLARELADRFRSRGHDVYLVGGAVRDALLGRPIRELDFATSAPPSVTVEILESFGTRSPYRVGEKFGTIGYHSGELRIEITTYRSREVYQPGSRKPDVQFGRSLEEDLSRRDFTINAIAWDPSTDALIDPLGGIQDLLDGVIRAVGTAEDRFREDPLRLLRAVRFSAVLDFAIESETWRAILMSAPALESISRERLREEFTRLLESDHPSEGMGLLRDAGLLAFSVPQLLELTRMPDHGPRHPLSLWDHTMRVLQAVPPILVVRWAALLHDIAKPATRTYEANGRPRFFHHEELGAQMVRDILGGLRYPTTIVQSVALLVESHMQLHAYSTEWSDGALRRLCLRLGPLLDDAIMLARADAAGHTVDGRSANAPKFNELERRVAQIDREGVGELKSPLNGDDLMSRYNRPPGPWIRTVKSRLMDEVFEGRLRPDDTEAAWRIADELIAG